MTYELTWRNQCDLCQEAKTIHDLIEALRSAAAHLQTMADRGVTFSDSNGASDDYYSLITDDPAVASEFGFEAALDEDETFDTNLPVK